MYNSLQLSLSPSPLLLGQRKAVSQTTNFKGTDTTIINVSDKSHIEKQKTNDEGKGEFLILRKLL